MDMDVNVRYARTTDGKVHIVFRDVPKYEAMDLIEESEWTDHRASCVMLKSTSIKYYRYSDILIVDRDLTKVRDFKITKETTMEKINMSLFSSTNTQSYLWEQAIDSIANILYSILKDNPSNINEQRSVRERLDILTILKKDLVGMYALGNEGHHFAESYIKLGEDLLNDRHALSKWERKRITGDEWIDIPGVTMPVWNDEYIYRRKPSVEELALTEAEIQHQKHMELLTMTELLLTDMKNDVDLKEYWEELITGEWVVLSLGIPDLNYPDRYRRKPQ